MYKDTTLYIDIWLFLTRGYVLSSIICIRLVRLMLPSCWITSCNMQDTVLRNDTSTLHVRIYNITATGHSYFSMHEYKTMNKQTHAHITPACVPIVWWLILQPPDHTVVEAQSLYARRVSRPRASHRANDSLDTRQRVLVAWSCLLIVIHLWYDVCLSGSRSQLK